MDLIPTSRKQCSAAVLGQTVVAKCRVSILFVTVVHRSTTLIEQDTNFESRGLGYIA